MTNKLSRRYFLKTSGFSAGALMLANAGLPAGLLRNIQHASVPNAKVAANLGDVELLVGDVVGFSLEPGDWTGAFGWVTFQLHQGLHNGESVYYIRTDASDEAFAQENHLVSVPLLNAAMAAEGATSQLYTFTNGADEQLPVMSSTPASEDFSSAWQVHQVTFKGSPALLDSVEAIRAAESNGELTIEALRLVVNFPVVKWAGGELPEDTAKDSYLGTGPLISPVDTERMRVTFKLHECFPGSRYIITDTSAAPMAPMMGIAPSAPTQALKNVGATDEIWVFGNGIPGSGVMGFQKAIFDNAAGTPVWSPFWDHLTIVWNDESNARILTSSAEVRAAQEAGEIEIFNGTPDTHPDGFVVNCPVPVKARNT